MKKLVLLVEADRALADAIQAAVSPLGLDVLLEPVAERAIARLEDPDLALAVIRWSGAENDGLGLLDRCRFAHPPVPAILLARGPSTESVVRLFRRGASDVLLDPFSGDEAAELCRRVLAHHGQYSDLSFARRAVSTPESSTDLVGESEVIREVRRLIANVAGTRCSVLITGESGTGKELVARAIHAASPVATGPFLAVNCAALPPALLESELFGHVRGSFTGAHQDRAGYFEAAHGGTLFLDEVGELPLQLQPKLLRAIQEREIHRVGATRPTPIDVRLVTATNRDLRQECAERRFRDDLYFRICVVEVRTPPLRQRKEDLPLLVEHLLVRISRGLGRAARGLEPGVLQRLMRHAWPGNVRELENMLERAMTVGRGELLALDDFPIEIRGEDAQPDRTVDFREASRRFERDHIRAVLWETRGNREEAAKRLGVSASTLYRKLLDLGIATETKAYRSMPSEAPPAR